MTPSVACVGGVVDTALDLIVWSWVRFSDSFFFLFLSFLIATVFFAHCTREVNDDHKTLKCHYKGLLTWGWPHRVSSLGEHKKQCIWGALPLRLTMSQYSFCDGPILYHAVLPIHFCVFLCTCWQKNDADKRRWSAWPRGARYAWRAWVVGLHGVKYVVVSLAMEFIYPNALHV